MICRNDGSVEVPEQLTLRVGQSTSFRLPGLGTAGYRWAASTDSEAVGVQWHRDLDEADDPPPPVGVSAPETVTLIGRRPGVSTIELIQSRPWESPEAALDRRRITVTVVE